MYKSAIVSNVLGRVRLRHKALQGKNLDKEIEALQVINGITSVVYTTSTGSILIQYKPKIFAEKEMHKELEKLFSPIISAYKAPVKSECTCNIIAPLQDIAQKAALHYGKKKCSDFMINAMKATLIPSVVLGFTNAKRMHVILGGAFLVFAVGHTLMYKKEK